jgi:hypothetical protein
MMNLRCKIVRRKMCGNDFCCYLAGEDGVVDWCVAAARRGGATRVDEREVRECGLKEEMIWRV